MLRNLIYIRFPAVTNVEEWTNDEPEVGAIIAIDNQVEKGICALLIKAINNKKNHYKFIYFIKSQISSSTICY